MFRVDVYAELDERRGNEKNQIFYQRLWMEDDTWGERGGLMDDRGEVLKMKVVQESEES